MKTEAGLLLALALGLTGCEASPTTATGAWTLSEPVFEVGGMTEDVRYAFTEVVGGIRLDDGKVIVADRGFNGLRMFSPGLATS